MAIPSGRHNDWIWPFSLIPRTANAIPGDPPTDITYSANFDHEHKNPDVPNPGAWALSKHPKYGFCYAWTGTNGQVFRVGTFRYDYVDRYFTFPTLAFHL